MKKFIVALMAVAVLSASFVSCDKKGGDPKEPEGISGSIGSGETLNLTPGNEYILDGPLLVDDGGVLNIAPGTIIKAKRGFNSYVLVLQGGKINATGTAANPIRFRADTDNAGAGYWGGLIINGKAPLAGGSVGSTEVNSAYQYGGTNTADNSGVLTYVILESTGARSSADVEHNGLTLNGVGNGTKIENIFVPEGSDDGIEFFGGTVNVKNLLVVNSDDDMFDFTQGYKGTLENAYGVWTKGFTSTESDPRGVESDGNFDGNFPTHTNQSNLTIKNMTIDLRLDFNANKATQMQDVIKVRRGAKANITNALVKGTGSVGDLVDMGDGKGFGDTSSFISITNQLSSPIGGKEVNSSATINGEKQERSFPDVKVEAGNTGCATDIFSWTKYSF